MSDSSTLKVRNMEPNDFKLHGVPVILKEGDNAIKVEHWLVIKKIVEKNISAGFISIDRSEESQAIEAYKKKCFSEFELLGISSVKVSSQKGKLSEGIKHSLALEWLSSKEESREENRDNREIESLSIAKRSIKISKCAIVVSTITAIFVSLITVWLTIKFGK